MLPARTPTRSWLAAASNPAHLAVGALGAVFTAMSLHLVWTLPVSLAAYVALVIRYVYGSHALAADPLLAAGPEIDWPAERQAVESVYAHTLLERIEAVEQRVTRLTREASGEAQCVLVAALAQIRDAARSGVALARGIDRVEAVIYAAQSDRARADANALRARAEVQSDRVVSDTLAAAARQRTAHATQATVIAVVNERMKAEGEQLVAQLQHAALNAEWSAAKPLVFERIRADTSVVRETLAELQAMEARGSLEPRAASIPAAAHVLAHR